MKNYTFVNIYQYLRFRCARICAACTEKLIGHDRTYTCAFVKKRNKKIIKTVCRGRGGVRRIIYIITFEKPCVCLSRGGKSVTARWTAFRLAIHHRPRGPSRLRAIAAYLSRRWSTACAPRIRVAARHIAATRRGETQ